MIAAAVTAGYKYDTVLVGNKTISGRTTLKRTGKALLFRAWNSGLGCRNQSPIAQLPFSAITGTIHVSALHAYMPINQVFVFLPFPLSPSYFYFYFYFNSSPKPSATGAASLTQCSISHNLFVSPTLLVSLQEKCWIS